MAYLTIISNTENNWQALTPELHCVGTARTREAVIQQAREAIALTLEGNQQRAAMVTTLEQVAAEVRAELDGTEEIVILEPAPMNPVSAEIERALAEAGVSQAELARRIGTTRSTVSRLVNPFYWGHSVDTLRRIAEALEVKLVVGFEAA